MLKLTLTLNPNQPWIVTWKQLINYLISGPSSNDDYLGHSKNHDWLIVDWSIEVPIWSTETYFATVIPC